MRRRAWAPIGERPIAAGRHRFERLYVTGFVEPETGRTVWNVATVIFKEIFEFILADFAETAGAGASKRIVLQFDNAGWRGPQNLAIPDAVRLVFQPAHSPEPQPAAPLCEFVDELVNACFESLDALDQTVAERCIDLAGQCDMIPTPRSFTGGRVKANRSDQPKYGMKRQASLTSYSEPTPRIEALKPRRATERIRPTLADTGGALL